MTIQFKIQIRGIKKPPVWRRIAIPGNFTFHDFHNTIQAAFGWWNEHLYMFQQRPYDHGWTVKKLDTNIDNMWEELPENAEETNVSSFIQRMELKKFVYVYDFGDSWVHDITVENIDNDAELDHPVCLAGKGACPPEDCGGVWDYEEMKEEMNQEEISKFDLEEVNGELKTITAASKNSKSQNDDNGLQRHSANNVPKPVKLKNVVNKTIKEELVSFAEDLGLDVNKNLSKRQYYEQYVQAVLDNPVKVLRQLSLEDLSILDFLKKHPTEGNVVKHQDNFYTPLIEMYKLVDYWDDNNHQFYIQVPEDLWEAMSPHIEEIMDDPAIQYRMSIENFVLGLTNLYGLVSASFVEQELVRTGMVETIEKARTDLSAVRKDALLLKFIAYQTDFYTDGTTADNTLFLSRYGWDIPNEFLRESAKYDSLASDYKQFSKLEIFRASATPIPQFVNPAQDALYNLLANDLKLNKWQALEVCHDIWFCEMRKYDKCYNFEGKITPAYFLNHFVLEGCNCSDSLRHKAMELMDDYLNNMPHWLLKGHTPKEVQGLLSEEAKAAKREHTHRQIYEHSDNFLYGDWLDPEEITMPIVVEKTPGRNEPCPCGSGKKYKNCCGRGT